MFGLKHTRRRAPAKERVFQRSPDALSVEHGGRTVVLDLRSEEYFALDDVGAALWGLLEDGHSFDHLADRIAVQYDAPPEQIRADVEEFLAGLIRDRLVVEVSR